MGGLTAAEVQQRIAEGKTNSARTQTSRTTAEILRANLVTRFNAIVSALVAVVLVFGHPIDAMFGLVMVANAVIGIVQELRAKRTLDRLHILVTPEVTVLRDDQKFKISVDDLVEGDWFEVEVGDQIPVDATVVEVRSLEVDESSLTGEADSASKLVGETVWSGSAVVSGSATLLATKVGDEAWVHQLVAEAKTFARTKSELADGVEQILRFISYGLVPVAALLFYSQTRSHTAVGEGLVAATAGVVGLIPQGLVLLISMAMAVAVIELGRRNVVVQELSAVEGLARADIVCLDKTGTLTTGRPVFDGVEPLGNPSEAEIVAALAAMVAGAATPTGSLLAIEESVGSQSSWVVESQVAFNSTRKWSSVSFAGQGTYVLGAPEILQRFLVTGSPAFSDRLQLLTSAAKRVLLLGHCPGAMTGEDEPEDLEALALVILSEELRSDAAEIISYFERQSVSVKIISGDSPTTVAAIGSTLGIAGVDKVIDMSTVTDVTPEIASEHTIFGRVSPTQKRQIVERLQEQGHNVAMTGDGVNDIPSLKKANIGIAMNTATPATKAVAQVVLLDDNFARLPDVVAEGRRVVANMERVSSLFLTKTIYAALFAVVVGIFLLPFPLLPRHFTLVDSLTIGIPGFFLSFRHASDPIKPGYLNRVLRFSIPAGLLAGGFTLGAYLTARGPGGSALSEARTISTLALSIAGFYILYRLIRPIDNYEGVLLGSLVAGFVVAFGVGPISNFYALVLPDHEGGEFALAFIGLGVVLAQLVLQPWGNLPQDQSDHKDRSG